MKIAGGVGTFLILLGIAMFARDPVPRDISEMSREEVMKLGVPITPGRLTTAAGVLDETYESEDVPYIHCGPRYGADHPSKRPKKTVEMLMLHGADHTHQDWLTRGILGALCKRNPNLSVTVANVKTVEASCPAAQLVGIVKALRDKEMILTGDPVVVVSPSTSGSDVVALSQHHKVYLNHVVRAWVPIASPEVLSADAKDLEKFAEQGIPVLAMHGTEDEEGKKVGEKLKLHANAEVATFEGGHSGYFDRQQEFVDILLKFIEKNT